MAEVNFDAIPRGTGRSTGQGERLAMIEADFDLDTQYGGIRPGSIATTWGVSMPPQTNFDLQTRFFSEVVYDGPGTRTDLNFPHRSSPHYAGFSRTDPDLERRELPNGGVLYVKRQVIGEELLQLESTTRYGEPRTPEQAGYHEFYTLADAGEPNPDVLGFNETEAAAILGGLARILVPGEEDAQWVTQQLLPSGELPSA